MSYILEALRKSEQDRQLGSVPTLSCAQGPAVNEPAVTWPWLLLVLVLVTALASVSVLLWQRGHELPAQQPTRANDNGRIEPRQASVLLPGVVAYSDSKSILTGEQRSIDPLMNTPRWAEQYYSHSSSQAFSQPLATTAAPLDEAMADPVPTLDVSNLDVSKLDAPSLPAGRPLREKQAGPEAKPVDPSVRRETAQGVEEQGTLLASPNRLSQRSVVEPVTAIAAELPIASHPLAMARVDGSTQQPLSDTAKTTVPAPVRLAAQDPPPLSVPVNTLPVDRLQRGAGSSAPDLLEQAQRAASVMAAASAVEPWAPLLQELPESFRLNVPPITMNVHAYSQQDSRRFVAIDLKRYVEGDEIANGMRLESITRDGVIVQYRGKRFRLLRL